MSKDEEKALEALFCAIAYIASLPKGKADELGRILKKCGKWKPSFELADLALPEKTGDYLAYVRYSDSDGEYGGEGWEVLAYLGSQRKFMIADSLVHVEILAWSALPEI